MKKITLIILTAGILTACNSGSNSPYSFSITNISPASGSTININNPTFTATFNNPVNGSTVYIQNNSSGNIRLSYTSTGVLIPINCNISPVSSTAVICSAANNLQNNAYTLTFTTGVQSTTGVSLSNSSYNYTIQVN